MADIGENLNCCEHPFISAMVLDIPIIMGSMSYFFLDRTPIMRVIIELKTFRILIIVMGVMSVGIMFSRVCPTSAPQAIAFP